jgi:hypothetical protein
VEKVSYSRWSKVNLTRWWILYCRCSVVQFSECAENVGARPSRKRARKRRPAGIPQGSATITIYLRRVFHKEVGPLPGGVNALVSLKEERARLYWREDLERILTVSFLMVRPNAVPFIKHQKQ